MEDHCSKLSTQEELMNLDKSELITRILNLETSMLRLLKGKQKEQKKQKSFNFSSCHKRKILLKLYYLGWNYHGFVTQDNSTNTIEDHLFAALKKSCLVENRITSNYHRCGRTDKGVSAFSQVISLEIRSSLAPDEQSQLEKELPYCKLLNRLLPKDIRCIAWSPIPENFSARFDCKYRTYKYFFPRGNLNISAMNQAAKKVVGLHDFRNICKMDVANGVVNFERNVQEARVYCLEESDVPSSYNMCVLEIKSSAFLWHQIRCLMGILLLVGQEYEKPKIVSNLLNIKKFPQKPQYNMAHEVPLNLFCAEYENINWSHDANELKNIIKTLQEFWTLNNIKATMTRSMLTELEKNFNKEINYQNNCLLLGVKPKIYRPLSDRPTCESLEEKIQSVKIRKRKRDACN